MQCAHHGGVHCQLRPSSQRKAVHHHLKSPSVCHSWHCQIHVPNEHIRPHTPFRFPADPREKPLRRNIPTRAQAARWWPQTSRRRPHRQLRSDRRRACRRRRRSTTLNKCEGIVVSLPVGRAVRAAPAPSPACERIKALFWSETLENNSSRWCSSTLLLASCCQPWRAVPGSKSSGSRTGGRAPCGAAYQLGGSNPIVPVRVLAASAAADKNGVLGSSNSATNRSAIAG